jgi:hypothetical protein
MHNEQIYARLVRVPTCHFSSLLYRDYAIAYYACPALYYALHSDCCRMKGERWANMNLATSTEYMLTYILNIVYDNNDNPHAILFLYTGTS